ncbi:unnamed protein product [Lymnaea stagnalis]|uniref:DUF4706 domain-containing protein n=1 Tax=Lymnaea stagnalis TaxID=6523 RepID=A0AAV2H1Q7_LYMST
MAADASGVETVQVPFVKKCEFNYLDYFSRSNYLNKQIVTQEKSLIKYMGNRWDDLPPAQQDALIDLLFVEDNIRNKFSASTNRKTVSVHDLTVGQKGDEDSKLIQTSFPRLYINSGQKINVDFENDLWTWRDEHSGPFSWMSRSQQDLTLADLETENIAKPQPKSIKTDLEEEKLQKAPLEFVDLSNSWSRDIIDDYRRKENDIILTPSVSVLLGNVKNRNFLEEINPAFNQSCDDIPISSQQALETNSKSRNANAMAPPEKKSDNRECSTKYPSPKKLFGKTGYRKSTSDTVHGQDKLIGGEEKDSVNVYSNDVMESEWSSFVGDKKSKSATSTVAPVPMTIDRGDDGLFNSPYQGDSVCLIQASPSSLQPTPPAALVSPVHSEWSEESTPDHTTCLLKGMQSPQHHRRQPMTQLDMTSPDGGNVPGQTGNLKDDRASPLESDEILRVELEGGNITVTTESQKRDSDIPTTGFDFLDNW